MTRPTCSRRWKESHTSDTNTRSVPDGGGSFQGASSGDSPQTRLRPTGLVRARSRRRAARASTRGQLACLGVRPELRTGSELYVIVEVNGQEVSAEALWSTASSFGHFTAMQVRGRRTRGLALHLDRLGAGTRGLFDRGLAAGPVRAPI